MDWKEFSLAKKHNRRSIPIDDDTTLVLREINILYGGLGCATWDGGVILARWIHRNSALFAGKVALELGAGVGVSGIIAAKHTKKLFVSDYLPDVMDNAKYNFQVNLDEAELLGVEFCLLDWHKFLGVTVPPETDEHFCTKLSNRSAFVEQKWYSCATCFTDDSMGICEPCFDGFHRNHSPASAPRFSTFRCDCTHFHCASKPQLTANSIDIIFGSELVYSTLSCEALAATVECLLVEDGVFYQILQAKREGVALFCSVMREKGFICYVTRVPPEFLLDTNTREWERKGKEDFLFYTWKKVTSKYPAMSG